MCVVVVVVWGGGSGVGGEGLMCVCVGGGGGGSGGGGEGLGREEGCRDGQASRSAASGGEGRAGDIDGRWLTQVHLWPVRGWEVHWESWLGAAAAACQGHGDISA